MFAYINPRLLSSSKWKKEKSFFIRFLCARCEYIVFRVLESARERCQMTNCSPFNIHYSICSDTRKIKLNIFVITMETPQLFVYRPTNLFKSLRNRHNSPAVVLRTLKNALQSETLWVCAKRGPPKKLKFEESKSFFISLKLQTSNSVCSMIS